ncbi:MAG: hypothetical protein KIS83_07805 [Rubrivivax sp.]|nr:hypothetical protein [Rubrivivax sp.]
MPLRVLSSNVALSVGATGLLAVGLVASFAASNFQWFSRFGALVICLGIIALARPSIVRAEIKVPILMAETGLSYLDPKHYEKTGEPVPEWVREDQKSRFAVGVLGPLLCLLGTGVNGFGDLLNRFLGW